MDLPFDTLLRLHSIGTSSRPAGRHRPNAWPGFCRRRWRKSARGWSVWLPARRSCCSPRAANDDGGSSLRPAHSLPCTRGSQSYFGACVWDALGIMAMLRARRHARYFLSLLRGGAGDRGRCGAIDLRAASSISVFPPDDGGRTSSSAERRCCSSVAKSTSTAGVRNGNSRGAGFSRSNRHGGWRKPGTASKMSSDWRRATWKKPNGFSRAWDLRAVLESSPA